MTRKHYRGLGRVTFIWNGTQSDPTLVYKKHKFNYYDIEDIFYNMFKEDNSNNDSNDTLFNRWIKENKSTCYSSLDDLISIT